jgi:hypothetical protein
MGNTPVFASAAEAVELARAALGYLASADATGLTAEEQAGCLQGLERVTSVTTAARSSVLGAFTAGKGYSADADYSPRAWLIRKTGVTRGAAVSYTAWAKRAVAHPRVDEVLAAGDVSESVARTVCVWTGKLPAGSRDAADGILMGAAVAGVGLRDLAVLASEMLARSWQPDKWDPSPETGPDGQGSRPDEDPGEDPGDQPGGAGAGDNSQQQPGAGGDGQPDEDEVFEVRGCCTGT